MPLALLLGACTPIVGTPTSSNGDVPVPEFFYPTSVGVPGLASASATITQLTEDLAVTAEHAKIVAYQFEEVGSSPNGHDLFYFLHKGEPAIFSVTGVLLVGDPIWAFGVTSDRIPRYVEGTLVSQDFWFNRKATSCGQLSKVEDIDQIEGGSDETE
jgi:hypothetical protein